MNKQRRVLLKKNKEIAGFAIMKADGILLENHLCLESNTMLYLTNTISSLPKDLTSNAKNVRGFLVRSEKLTFLFSLVNDLIVITQLIGEFNVDEVDTKVRSHLKDIDLSESPSERQTCKAVKSVKPMKPHRNAPQGLNLGPIVEIDNNACIHEALNLAKNSTVTEQNSSQTYQFAFEDDTPTWRKFLLPSVLVATVAVVATALTLIKPANLKEDENPVSLLSNNTEVSNTLENTETEEIEIPPGTTVPTIVSSESIEAYVEGAEVIFSNNSEDLDVPAESLVGR